MKESNFIYGIRPVIEAIDAGKELDKIFIKKGLSGPLFSEMMGKLKNTGIPYQYVPIEKLNRISRKNHQGVIALNAIIQYQNIEQLMPILFEAGKDPFLLVLDGLTDVRNFGAVIRAAECAGVDAVLIPVKGSAQINEDAMKTSAGALNNVPICRTDDLIEAINYLKNSGIVIIGATEKTDKFYYDLDFKVPLALVMGSEESGISSQILSLLDAKAKIPLKGSIASLNVSVAAGILLYEAVRQRLDS